MTPGERWLAATWPFVRSGLPAPPARVVDLGCGPLGGFVPMLRAGGYDAVGIDPQAPEEAHYQRIEFERADLPQQVDAVIASTSLHHVADPAQVIDRMTSTLIGGGAVVVVEWAWEKFDEQTAEWCFERLERQLLAHGAYFFPDLAATTEADEQSAIDAGDIRPARIDYVGTAP